MNEQKPNYPIILYNFLIFVGYMSILGKFNNISLLLLPIHLLLLFILSVAFLVNGNRARAGMFFLSFWLILLVSFGGCMLLFSLASRPGSKL